MVGSPTVFLIKHKNSSKDVLSVDSHKALPVLELGISMEAFERPENLEELDRALLESPFCPPFRFFL